MNASRTSVVSALTAALVATPKPAASATEDPPAGPVPAVAGDVPQESTDVRRGLPALPPIDEQSAPGPALPKSAPARISRRATWDTSSGTPRTVRAPAGHLTGPQAGEATAVAGDRLQAHRAASGLSAADVEALAVRPDHELPCGARAVSCPQTAAGVEAVRGGVTTVAVAEDGRGLPSAGDRVLIGGPLAGFDTSLSPPSGSLLLPTGRTLLHLHGAHRQFTLTARQAG
ncbi:hypothetical protein AB0K02_26865 [Streptomyces sp. NPDC049597]|uniref:hypothetical protein n=1 Tax=Streptomyces sp. NPDC049597 TaxID=3155276 RepID=UPI003442DCAF